MHEHVSEKFLSRKKLEKSAPIYYMVEQNKENERLAELMRDLVLNREKLAPTSSDEKGVGSQKIDETANI